MCEGVCKGQKTASSLHYILSQAFLLNLKFTISVRLARQQVLEICPFPCTVPLPQHYGSDAHFHARSLHRHLGILTLVFIFVHQTIFPLSQDSSSKLWPFHFIYRLLLGPKDSGCKVKGRENFRFYLDFQKHFVSPVLSHRSGLVVVARF